MGMILSPSEINNLIIVWEGLFYFQFYVRELSLGYLCALLNLQRKPTSERTGCSCSGLLYLNLNIYTQTSCNLPNSCKI